ncbi:microcin-processing peptidase 1 [Paraburkholderia caballeronis]|nr:microcin-processing peptidase 1 [Paraburkholderia caballeronis]
MDGGYMGNSTSRFGGEAIRTHRKQDNDMKAATPEAASALARGEDELKQLATDVLGYAKRIGATGAVAHVTEGEGRSVSVRLGETETIEFSRDKRIDVTVLIGNHSGKAGTSDFSRAALKDTVAAAYHIARFAADDPAGGLTEEEWFERAPPDLDLYHAWPLPASDAAALARRAESAAFAVSPLICNSEGASVSSRGQQFVLATSNGFIGGYASSQHMLACVPIAGSDGLMQKEPWYVSARCPADLATPEAVGRYAAQRAVARIGARRLDTCKVPVLFDAPLATGLLGSFAQAASGGALYRNASFLVGGLGKRVFAPHVQIVEDPHILRGFGSAPFDDEGVRTRRRDVVRDGVLSGYFLSTYSARKLGLYTTGNAGGAHHLTLRSTHTHPADDLDMMLRRLDTGLFVTALIGQGVNTVTGSYSRGAAGYWVERGVIQYPVQEITIAGSLQDMFARIVAVGADSFVRGAMESGSVLIEQMTVAGQ